MRKIFFVFVVVACVIGCGLKDVRYYHNEGVQHEKKGAMAKAVTSYLEAIKLDDEHFYSLFNLGNVYFAQKNYKEAKKYFIKAVIARTNYFPAYFNLGLTYMELKNPKKGYESFRRAAIVEKKGNEAFLTHASYLVKDGENQKALLLLQKAKRKTPQDYRVYYNLGYVYLEMEKKKEALTALEKAVKLNNKDISGLVLLARCYLLFPKEKKYMEKVAKIIEDLKKKHPKDKYVLLVSARYDIARNKWQKAYKILKTFSERFPDSYNAQMLLGQFFMRQKKYEKALGYYQKASSIQFSRKQPLVKIAEIQLLRRKNHAARKVLTRLFRYFPKSEVVLWLNLKMNYLMGEYERAIRYGDKLLLINAKHKRGALLTGLSYLKVEDDTLRKPKKAVRLLWPLRTVYRKNRVVMRYLYRALKEIDDSKRAEQIKKLF